MSRREFLQLAHNFNPDKHGVGGWYASEKLDGMRAYWDGGWTRGLLTSQVPFANTLKDFRRVTQPHSTGLWSRYSKPIAAPDWWLDSLPDFPLDGELYLGPGRFQEVISTVKKFEPVDEEWERVEFRVFDLPPDHTFLAPGKINNPQWTATFDDMRELAPARKYGPMNFHKINRMIESRKISLGSGPAFWEPQVRLSMVTGEANEQIDALLDEITSHGGEGVIVRKPESIWTPQRTWDLLKIKPQHDAEAVVRGFVWGRGKLEGLFGAMIVEWNGKTFELSGFTDEERQLYYFGGEKASGTPGTEVDPTVGSQVFPRNSTVTFKYRELTDDGIPKEARYWRK